MPVVTDTDEDLKQLLAESTQLNAHLGQERLTRTLHQLNDDARRYNRGVDANTEAKAQMLLAAREIDIPELTRTLQDVTSMNIYASQEQLTDLDIEQFLKRELHQKNLNAAIDESIKITAHLFRAHHRRKLDDDWNEAKRKILEEHMLRGAPAQLKASTAPMETSSTATSLVVASQSRLPFSLGNRRMDDYAQVVKSLNDETKFRNIKGEPLIRKFKRACEGTRRNQQRDSQLDILSSCWDYVHSLVPTDRTKSDDAAYWTHLIHSSAECSERFYQDHIDRSVRRKIQRVGSNPQKVNQVAAYLHNLTTTQNTLSNILRRSRDTCSENDMILPTWAWIYYCFRCGYLVAARDVARKHLPNTTFEKFIKALEHIVDCRKTKSPPWPADKWQLKEDLQEEYIEYMRGTTNSEPFFEIMYLLVSRSSFDPQRYKKVKDVIQTIDDYIWLKLTLLRNRKQDELSPHAPKSLTGLQGDVCNKGARYFNNNGTNPMLYFKILLMTLQFDIAVNYIMHSKYYIDGLHFAMALNHFRMLKGTRIDSWIEKYADSFPRPEGKINEVSVFYAFHYFLALRHAGCEGKMGHPRTGGSDRDKLIIDSLLLDEQKAKCILEPMRNAKNDLLDQYLQKDKNKLLQNASKEARERGKVVHSIDLAVRGEDYDGAARILVQEFASELEHWQKEETKMGKRGRLRLFETARNMLRDARIHMERYPRVHMRDLNYLLEFHKYFELYFNSQFDACEEILRDAKLIPQDESDIEQNYKSMPNFREAKVKRVFERVVEYQMNCYSRKFQFQITNGNRGELNEIRRRAKMLEEFAKKFLSTEISSKISFTQTMY